MSPLVRRASAARLAAAQRTLDRRARQRGLTPRERVARIVITREMSKRGLTAH